MGDYTWVKDYFSIWGSKLILIPGEFDCNYGFLVMVEPS